MKIGFVYTKREKSGPYVQGERIAFGPFAPPRSAPDFCPKVFFEFPIKRLVTAIVWEAPTATGHYVAMQLFDWSQRDEVGTVEEFGGEREGFVPQFAILEEPPSPELRAMLQCAKEYWEPFTSLKAAHKLFPTLLELSSSELTDFLEHLGQSRNLQTLRVRRENFFIAKRWIDWERFEASYEERVADMHNHGFSITLAAFKQRVGKHQLNFPRRFRE